MQVSTLSNRALFYLFFSILVALLLHSEYLPIWTLVLAPSILCWRYFIFSAKLGFPNAVVKFLLVLAGFYAVYLTYGFNFSIESAVTLLIAGVALKPLEVQSRRDSYVLIFLCYMIQGLHFLFEQGPLSYILVIFSMFITLVAQVVVNQSANASVKFSLPFKVLLLSIPLTVFLFFILPRLAPLWSLNISTKAGVVGLSDSMSPGEISELGKSDELAFRVVFTGDVPPMKDRYWRALVLNEYDGSTWSTVGIPSVKWRGFSNKQEVGYQYQITAEPHEKKWLFSLANSTPTQPLIGLTSDNLLISRYKLLNKFQYTASAQSDEPRGSVKLSALDRGRNLQLPIELNARAVELSNKINLASNNTNEFVTQLRSYYLSQEFVYTLSPALNESEDKVDEFLFDSKEGFCAHYAGSAVYLLRSAGIPARVVLGYLGGERNTIGDYYSVYQYDAHAWVEYWLDDRGWQRLDPTGWVSPNRVEQGIESAIKDEFSGFRAQSKWMKALRDQFQAFDFYWNNWMLSYKGDKQQGFLDAVFGQKDALQIFFMISGMFLGIFAFIFVVVLWQTPKIKYTAEQLAFRRYIKGLRSADIHADSSMTVRYLGDLVLARNSTLGSEVGEINDLFDELVYKPSAEVGDTIKLKVLNKKIKKLIIGLVKRS